MIRQWFDELKSQEAGKGKFGRLETGPGAFGVVRRIGQDEGMFYLICSRAIMNTQSKCLISIAPLEKLNVTYIEGTLNRFSLT